MGIEDTIIKVVRDENNMLLGKLEDVINHAISGIKKGNRIIRVHLQRIVEAFECN